MPTGSDFHHTLVRMDPHRIACARAPLHGELRAPPSKSATHRALFLAALADGDSSIVGPLDSEDTRASIDAVRGFGAEVRERPGAWSVTGFGGSPRGAGRLDLRESGTTMRFAAALAALAREPTRLEGRGRLGSRPMTELYSAIEALGGRVERAPGGAALPATIAGPLSGGRSVRVAGDRSSQFVSALLTVAPRISGGLLVEVATPLVSADYVALTREALERFGIEVEEPAANAWRVRPASFAGREVHIEGDWSSASCLLTAPAIVGGRLTVTGLRGGSLQPDRAIVELLRAAGCRVWERHEEVEVGGDGRVGGFEFDLGGRPDLAPAGAVLMLFAEGPAALRNVAHLRHKESDRFEVLRAALTALGRRVRVDGDDLVADRGARPGDLSGARVQTASDHRIAMAFAVAGLRLAGVELDDRACVAKSYPGFWTDFARLGGQNW